MHNHQHILPPPRSHLSSPSFLHAAHSHVTSPLPVLTHVNNSTLLVEICEVAPCLVKMPRTLQLVKQLGRELNITKILKEQKRKGERQVECARVK